MRKDLIISVALVGLLAAIPAISDAADVITNTTELGSLAAPVTMSFGSSFNDQQPLVAGLQITRSGIPLSLQTSDTFVEQYRFTADAVDITAIVGTIDLAGILNLDALQMHLYQGPGANLGSIGAGSLLTGLTPVVSSSGNADLQKIEGATLTGGTYVLELRGQVSGLVGGSYAGVLNLVPVPDAAPWMLAAAGLAVLAVARKAGRG